MVTFKLKTGRMKLVTFKLKTGRSLHVNPERVNAVWECTNGDTCISVGGGSGVDPESGDVFIVAESHLGVVDRLRK